MKKHIYTARKQKSEGRNYFSVAFRHPMKQEQGRPGRQICRGLKTDNEARADAVVAGLNELLGATELHSLAGEEEARRRGFDPQVIEIFYEGLEPASTVSHRELRNQMLPFPEGHTLNLLAGITGSGKSTVLRRLIGSIAERFPATSINRTTTCPLEIITGADGYTAAITILSQHQT